MIMMNKIMMNKRLISEQKYNVLNFVMTKNDRLFSK